MGHSPFTMAAVRGDQTRNPAVQQETDATSGPSCECCDRDLPPTSLHERICSFECTFRSTCAGGVLAGRCPNCAGELVPRPRRPPEKLSRHPASSERITNPLGCAGRN